MTPEMDQCLLLLAQWTLFAGNFAVYFSNPLPLWVHLPIGVLAIHFAFTIWHEAAHGSVSSEAWVNRVVGVLGMFPYMTPFFTQQHVHLEHHRLEEGGGALGEVHRQVPSARRQGEQHLVVVRVAELVGQGHQVAWRAVVGEIDP